MPKKVILTRGLPGSGKSSWAKEFVLQHPNEYKRVNMDDMRVMLDNKLVVSKDAEKFMKRMRDILIIEALKDDKNVISDNTHLSPKSVEHIKQLVHKFNKDNNDNVEVEVKFFDVPVEECIKRDLKRANSVGEKVIREMYEQFLEPKSEPLIQDPSLPHAYLVDIDGTVAEMTERGPFDWKRVGEDLPKEDVLRIIRILHNAGKQIIFFSGRDEVCRQETEEWLNKHFSKNYDLSFLLYMRTKDDNRNDGIVKKEMFDKYIRDKYFIEAVLDDRDRVVRVWRKEIGLTCLQVNYGNF